MRLQDFDFRIWVDGEGYIKGTARTSLEKSDGSLRVIKSDYGEDIGDIFNCAYLAQETEIELWTGFYDKKGNKIYEGDILKLTKKRESNITKARCYVEYEGGCFVLYGLNRYYEGTLDTNLSYQDAEIIGNIHEN